MEKISIKRAISLESEDVRSALKIFCDILKSSIGPSGNLKLLVTSGGYSELASTSSTIVNRLDFSCPLCTYISHIMQQLTDFGLYFGVATTSFLTNILVCKEYKQFSDVSVSFEKLLNLIASTVFSLGEFYGMELSVRNNLIPLVHSILLSKSIVNLSPEFSNILSTEIVNVFLMSLCDEGSLRGNIFVQLDKGPEACYAFQGIVYKFSGDNEAEIEKSVQKLSSKRILVLLFTFSVISNDNDYINICDFLDCASEKGVSVVASQKVIDEKIKSFLRKKSILVLERLGEEIAHSLEYLSSAVPISSINALETENVLNMAGTLSSIRVVSYGNFKYLLMEKSTSYAVTLLVFNRTFCNDELKILVRKCIKTLFTVNKAPNYLPGNGCFEANLYAEVMNEIKFEDKQFRSICTAFLKSLIQSANLMPDVKVDTLYYHAWSIKTRCNCGLITKEDLKEEEYLELKEIHKKPYKKTGLNVIFHENCIIDAYETKNSAILQILNTSMSVLDIGLIVNN